MIPGEVRAKLAEHAREALPNEACGLVLLRDGVAVDYVRGRNVQESPYRYRMELDPIVWADINDAEYEQAIFHSHPVTEPRPSPTDIENIGLWEGHPYLIMRADTGDLAAWTISGGEVSPLPLSG